MRSVRDKSARPIGRVVPAPEHHLSAETILGMRTAAEAIGLKGNPAAPVKT